MNFPFYKLAVGRNDLILINLMGEALPDEELLPILAKRICRRRRGVGASGLILLFDHEEAVAGLRFFTRRGEELSRFYDPILCAARYLFDSGHAGTKALTLGTPEGIRSIEAIDSSSFRISLGKATDAEGNEFHEMIEKEGGTYLAVEGRTYPVTPVLLSYLWGIFFFNADPRKGMAKIGKPMAASRLFSRKFHPVFVQIYSDDDIAFWPWWRKGSGYRELSLAAAAAAAGSAARGFTNRSLMARCGSYDLYLEWREGDGEFLCTAGAEYIFTGDYFFDEELFYGGGGA